MLDYRHPHNKPCDNGAHPMHLGMVYLTAKLCLCNSKIKIIISNWYTGPTFRFELLIFSSEHNALSGLRILVGIWSDNYDSDRKWWKSSKEYGKKKIWLVH